jgi:hypothetical protein
MRKSSNKKTHGERKKSPKIASIGVMIMPTLAFDNLGRKHLGHEN